MQVSDVRAKSGDKAMHRVVMGDPAAAAADRRRKIEMVSSSATSSLPGFPLVIDSEADANSASSIDGLEDVEAICTSLGLGDWSWLLGG